MKGSLFFSSVFETGIFIPKIKLELKYPWPKPKFIIVDNLVNSKPSVLANLKTITGQDITFYEGDIRDHKLMNRIFETENLDAVLHFAALKSVGESFEQPLEYYGNNVKGTIYLMDAMERYGVKTIIFSSSANIYGLQDQLPITENMPTGDVTNPYGRTKFMMEEILKDVQKSRSDWSVTLLRYFNPVGAHDSGLIGEDPDGVPSNLMPYIAKVANGELDKVAVFGDDYPTPDGTGVRDYIHVVDLAKGHTAALNKVGKTEGTHIYNLGTGIGVSVLELITSYETACGKKLSYDIKPRRKGDAPASYADTSKANKELEWQTTKSVADMCQDSWRWVSNKS